MSERMSPKALRSPCARSSIWPESSNGCSVAAERPLPWLTGTLQTADACLLVVDLADPDCLQHVSAVQDELARRRAAWTAPVPKLDSGYWKLYTDHVLQADEGADLDFLRCTRGAFVPRDNH